MTARRCGDCQLCCKLLPVRDGELDKGAGERCRFQHAGKGCAIHAQLARRVPSCALWSCSWLIDPEAAKLPRPDRCHFVVDIVPDFVHATPPGGERIDIPVMQVWIDPAFPQAARLARVARLDRACRDHPAHGDDHPVRCVARVHPSGALPVA